MNCKIENCQNSAKTRGWCRSHYIRWLRHGDPLKGGPYKGEVLSYLDESLKIKTDDCQIWPYAKTGDGFGFIRIDGKNVSLCGHVCEKFNGPRPEGNVVRHLCGNGHLGCYNPKHLAWGTQKQNLDDKLIHGRTYSRNSWDKLDECEVLEIYNSNLSNKELAAMYKITRVSVSRIKNGKTWAHLTGHIKKGGA